MHVIKRNRLLHIANEDGVVIYTPPSFVSVPDRGTLAILADRLAAGEGIRAIASFERAYGPRHQDEAEKKRERAAFRTGHALVRAPSTKQPETALLPGDTGRMIR